MKKIVLTLFVGLLFVAVSTAQSSTKVAEVASLTSETTTIDQAKATSCEPGCTKSCCADKKEVKQECKDEKASCEGKKASECKDEHSKKVSKKTSCETKTGPSCQSSKRPDTCGDH